MMNTHQDEIAHGDRFGFGENWSRFLSHLDDHRINEAERSLRSMLDVSRLDGKRFLDVGSGSGLSSLAARRLGATVHSFDYDPQSVACTRELRRRYFPDDEAWTIDEASVLDDSYMRSLGEFDIVYSWGVLHHTGQMWKALDAVHQPVTSGGLLFIAIYNDMGTQSARWVQIKKLYCSLPGFLRPAFALAAVAPEEGKQLIKSVVRLRPREYVRHWTRYSEKRGMSKWHDIVDWVGGYPYEYATSDQIVEFYEARGFSPATVRPTRGLGCNEFIFRRDDTPQNDSAA